MKSKKRKKERNVISINAGKGYDKILHPFMIKNPQQTGTTGELPELDEEYIQKTYSQYHIVW